VKSNRDALLLASKEIGIEVNADKTKYLITSRDQNAGRNHDIYRLITFPMKEFQYLGTTLTNHFLLRKKLRAA